MSASRQPVDDPYFHAYRVAAARVTDCRIRRGLSKYMLAKLATIDLKQLRAVEFQRAELSVLMAIKLSVVLDTTPQYLLFGVK